jgi:hypothetical protein
MINEATINMDSMTIHSPIGQQSIDASGSPVGVVRVDVDKSYLGIHELLQQYINDSDADSWEKIKAKIDYTFQQLGFALQLLEKETSFSREVREGLAGGQKLLFKPNLVTPLCIDPETHAGDMGVTACTEWSFVAALMRWFHDILGVSYHQMCIGEAATGMTAAAGYYSKVNSQQVSISPEAVMEGKVGDFYCGWGFYFVRKYLAEKLGGGAVDDPMIGYEESLAGTYIPPGEAPDRLLVYDLNRIFDDPTKGREVEVPGGVNFQSVTLHKAVIGANPSDSEDRKRYPGCILVNVPKFKVHAISLFTNVLKNLGIGLYPMQWAKQGGFRWEYSFPETQIPGMKAKIPHHIWVTEFDARNGVPKRAENGNYLTKKTGGINATMLDVLQAVRSQGTFMVHVVDGIEAINLDHQGIGLGKKEPEGMVFAGLDPVATDLLCARYMFSNVGMKEALESGLEDGADGRFPQKVPVPTVEGTNIITQPGYDCPLSRDRFFEAAERRGLGVRKYYVVGKDAVTDRRLVSVQGHLGTVNNGVFSDVVTKTLFFDLFKTPWDLQKTVFQYFSAMDRITGSSLKKEFLEAFAEDGDSPVIYEQFGKKGYLDVALHSGAESVSRMGTDPYGFLKGMFIQRSRMLKSAEPSWNTGGHDVFREVINGAASFAAYKMSQIPFESRDPFTPTLMWGKGKWPSIKLARFMYVGIQSYGVDFPFKLGFASLYGAAFRYADLTQNEGRYAGRSRTRPTQDALMRYSSQVKERQIAPLEFTFYLPAGYESVGGVKVPNVEVTEDTSKAFTASFQNGKEFWNALP